MDAVATVYRLVASMSPGIDGLRSDVEFHRRGRFDATITLHDGLDSGVLRQRLALRGVLERRNRHVWQGTTGLFGSTYHTLERVIPQGSPGRRNPPSARSANASTYLITDHWMIPREHLATWLGVSQGRVSQTVRSLVKDWSLVKRRGSLAFFRMRT